ncbi:MAG: M20/M25/M40 family metallo-hydrolase [Chloroflexi bacterium]|nr:M20/M25/M40 family metallo-hydrolase [Chloroflexota bacterium]
METRTAEIRARIAALLPTAQDLLVRLIATPSCSYEEEPLAILLSEEFRKSGLEAELAPLDDSLAFHELLARVTPGISYAGRHNLIVRLAGKKAGCGGLLLNAHMDTVPPAQQGSAGFRAGVKDGVITGRGACDAKGQIVTAYLMLRAMKELGLTPPLDVMLHLVVEEEVGGNGSLALTEKKWDYRKVVVLESTDLAILTATRGTWWFRILLRGKAGHSADPGGTVSALKMAVSAMGLLEAYHKDLLDRSRNTPPFEGFENPMPLTFGVLNSGTWPATVPDQATLEGVMGFLPNKTSAEISAEIRQLFEDSPLAGKYQLDVTIARDPSVTDRRDPLIAQISSACLEAGQSATLSVLPAFCDPWFYTRQGIPAVVFGAGSLKQCHSANESIPLAEIAVAAEVLVHLALQE